MFAMMPRRLLLRTLLGSCSIQSSLPGALLFVLVAAGLPASAQATWYTIELIAFQRLSEEGLYVENWPSDPGLPAVAGTVELSVPSALSLDEDDAALGFSGAYAFHLLDASELQLRAAATRLKRSKGYRPILHIAWRQPGFTRSKALAVHIHSNLPNPYYSEPAPEPEVALTDAIPITSIPAQRAGPPPMLDGTLRLSRARYLHVAADLVHHRAHATPMALGQSGAVLDDPLAPQVAELFRLQESRRMRSREIHYFDHPMFGLLVLVTPYQPAEPAPEEETAEEAAAQP